MSNEEIDRIQAGLELDGEIDTSDALELLNFTQERRWIDVKERLPEPGEDILFLEFGTVEKGWYSESKNIWFAFNAQGNKEKCVRVTHWQPLPKGPQ